MTLCPGMRVDPDAAGVRRIPCVKPTITAEQRLLRGVRIATTGMCGYGDAGSTVASRLVPDESSPVD